MKQRKCNLVIKAGEGLPGGLSGSSFIPGFTAGFLCDRTGAGGPDSASTSRRTPGAKPWDCSRGLCGVRTLLLEQLMSGSGNPSQGARGHCMSRSGAGIWESATMGRLSFTGIVLAMAQLPLGGPASHAGACAAGTKQAFEWWPSEPKSVLLCTHGPSSRSKAL